MAKIPMYAEARSDRIVFDGKVLKIERHNQLSRLLDLKPRSVKLVPVGQIANANPRRAAFGQWWAVTEFELANGSRVPVEHTRSQTKAVHALVEAVVEAIAQAPAE